MPRCSLGYATSTFVFTIAFVTAPAPAQAQDGDQKLAQQLVDFHVNNVIDNARIFRSASAV